MNKGNLLKSFQYAFAGIWVALKSERNLYIHIFFMLMVILAGFIFKINTYEWIICIILFIVVISAEMFNTAIETTVDIAMPQQHDLAKKAKDVAAGAVLITAIGAAVIGMIIFVPKIMSLF